MLPLRGKGKGFTNLFSLRKRRVPRIKPHRTEIVVRGFRTGIPVDVNRGGNGEKNSSRHRPGRAEGGRWESKDLERGRGETGNVETGGE